MKILDVHYDDLSEAQITQRILQLRQQDQQALVTYLNLDCLHKATLDAEYREILQNADLVCPDGIGLKLAILFCGQRKRAYTNATDFFLRLVRESAGSGARLYFLGSEPGVAQAAAEVLRAQNPGLLIAGTHHGYFQDDTAMVEQINASGADVLLLGTGAPRQEKWLWKHRAALKPKLLVAVGALFVWASGRQRRAPLLLQKLRLEWAWRILLEPQRLFRRYIMEDLPFLISLPLKGVQAVSDTAPET